jgi:phage-related protein
MGIIGHGEAAATSNQAATVAWEHEEGSPCIARRGNRYIRLRPAPAQIGKKHEQAKPLRGFGSAGVLEVVEDWRGNTYRAVYTVRFAAAVVVLHVFQKKAKSGVATPKQETELIRQRLTAAEQFMKEQ